MYDGARLAVRPKGVEKRFLVGMELEDLRLFLGPEQPRYRAQQLFDALYKKHVANFSEISNLPQPLLNQLVTISTLGVRKAKNASIQPMGHDATC